MRVTGLPSLCEVLKKNTSLEHLNLSQNELDVESVTLICTALQKNKTLKELDLASNRFECEGVTPLTDLLPHASSKQKSESQLQSLRLSHNRIQGTCLALHVFSYDDVFT
jgi:Ran GTPase-activating protein (RanGAP) involved in mRNA processing and transport